MGKERHERSSKKLRQPDPASGSTVRTEHSEQGSGKKLTFDEFVLECCILLDKTQHEIENEYAFIDLPKLMLKKNQRRARELLENIEIAVFPHLSDKKDREAILKRLKDALPKPPPEPQKSAEEQYEALKKRMMMGR